MVSAEEFEVLDVVNRTCRDTQGTEDRRSIDVSSSRHGAAVAAAAAAAPAGGNWISPLPSMSVVGLCNVRDIISEKTRTGPCSRISEVIDHAEMSFNPVS